jgi:hypothetical protein
MHLLARHPQVYVPSVLMGVVADLQDINARNMPLEIVVRVMNDVAGRRIIVGCAISLGLGLVAWRLIAEPDSVLYLCYMDW